jgi:hypothetical protein
MQGGQYSLRLKLGSAGDSAPGKKSLHGIALRHPRFFL